MSFVNGLRKDTADDEIGSSQELSYFYRCAQILGSLSAPCLVA